MPHEHLSKHLAKVLESDPFHVSPTSCALLGFMVNESIVNGRGKLSANDIATGALGQAQGFDTRTNPLVRVQVQRLRKALDHYYAHEGINDPWRISLPKGSYQPVFSKLGGHADPSSLLESSGKGFTPRLAVLPLENLSGDASKDYICDGITQEIIHLLTHCRELQLLASGTTFHYRTTPDRILDVGVELNVDYVLYGSIRIDAKEIRVTAFLYDVHIAQNVWTEQYRRELTPANVFEIQDDIAAVIVGQVSNPHGMLSRLSRSKEIDSFSAYAAVLRYYAYQESMDPESHLVAKIALEQAVSLYPNYAEAWGCLSAVYGGEHMFGFNAEPDAEPPLDRALAAAKKALQLVPDCIIGLYSLANCYYYRRELPDFRIAAQRAIELAPNRSDMLSGLALHIAYDGQWERGLKMLDKARNLNPLHPGWFWFPYSLNAYRQRNYEEALRYAKQINMPGFYWDHVFLAMIYGQLGSVKEAKIHLNQSVELNAGLLSDPENIIATIVLDPALAHHCVEGLAKAGLKISAK